MTADLQTDTATRGGTRLPWPGLIALFFAGFLTIMNETTPAGLLPEIARSLHVSESFAGQTVTIYALATGITAIPLSAFLARWGKRTVLVSALAAFVLANLAIAVTDSFALIMVARFVAGVGAGLIWTNLAVYAARLVSPAVQGRAMSIANAGTPVALALGLPLGTVLGDTMGWRVTFATMAFAGVVAIVWAFIALPNVPGEVGGERVSQRSMLRPRGVVTILAVMTGFFLAHNVLYTYVSSLTIAAGIGGQIEWVLLAFGLAALASIWITGVWIDRNHRRLVVFSMVLMAAATLVLGFVLLSPVLLYVATIAWGLGFGGGATLFLTAGIRAAGTEAIAATMVTLVNLAIAAGGVLGGVLLGAFGTLSLPWAALLIMIPVAITATVARRHAFPRWAADASN